MMIDPDYEAENYDFTLDPEIAREGVESLNNHIDNLIKWGKPALLLFGEHDSLMKKSKKALPDGHRIGNILVKHVRRASHVTPCMDDMVNLSKLDPAIIFFNNVAKAKSTNRIT